MIKIIKFEILEEKKEDMLLNIETYANDFMNDLIVNIFNNLINLKLQVDEFLGKSSEAVHDFIVKLLLGW